MNKHERDEEKRVERREKREAALGLIVTAAERQDSRVKTQKLFQATVQTMKGRRAAKRAEASLDRAAEAREQVLSGRVRELCPIHLHERWLASLEQEGYPVTGDLPSSAELASWKRILQQANKIDHLAYIEWAVAHWGQIRETIWQLKKVEFPAVMQLCNQQYIQQIVMMMLKDDSRIVLKSETKWEAAEKEDDRVIRIKLGS